MARKKEAHHGGAWKVAFADFMTAMMALFLVLWISAQDQKILIATAQYFRNPFNSPTDKSSGVMPFNSNKSTNAQGNDEGSEKVSENNKQIQLAFLNSVAADYYRLLHLDENLEDKPIDIQVTSDSLRVTLFDRASRPLFVKDTAEFTEWGRYAMQGLAWMIERHHFRVTIDGHTSKPGTEKSPDYTVWELSTDRANASRRSLVHYAVDSDYIERITGYGGTRPLPGEKPEAEANARVTLSLSLAAKPQKEHPADAVESAPALKNGARPRVADKKPLS
jgi:chemotaxis protein MotB